MIMRTHLALAATALLILSALSIAGPVLATDGSYEHGHSAEHDPDCRGENGERQTVGITLDPNNIDEITSQDFFGPDDKVTVPTDFEMGDEQFFTFCSGENWDGQDPNTKESDRNSEAGGSADEPVVDAQEGDVYVNPLWDGDCSGWNSDHHEDGGCAGGTDKPALTHPLHVRATADAPGPSDTDPAAGVYVNLEIWGVGRGSPTAGVDHTQEGAWVALYLEDHSDQSSDATIGTPLCDELAISNDCFDGNYLLIPFDPLQGGSGGEGDCTSHEYQSAQGEGTDDHDHSCRRDNTALVTLQFGYSWLDTPGATTGQPPTLP